MRDSESALLSTVGFTSRASWRSAISDWSERMLKVSSSDSKSSMLSTTAAGLPWRVMTANGSCSLTRIGITLILIDGSRRCLVGLDGVWHYCGHYDD